MRFIILTILLLNYSCYKNFDIDSNNSNIYYRLSRTQILNLIKDKENELEYFKKQKMILENKNKEYLFMINFQKSYNIDISYLENIFEKNNQEINKINLYIKKILLELKILKKYV